MVNNKKFNSFIPSHIYNTWKSAGFDRKVTSKVDSKGHATLEIFGIIDDNVVKKVKSLVDSKPNSTHLKIYSPGGSVYSCLAVYDMLRDVDNLSTEVIGVVASAAANIYMLGEKRLASKTSRILFHKVWLPVVGNDDELEAAMNECRTFDSDFLENLFLPKMKKTDEEIKNYLKENRFMTFEEMQEFNVFTDLKSDKTEKEEENKKTNSEIKNEVIEEEVDIDEGMSSSEKIILSLMREEKT